MAKLSRCACAIALSVTMVGHYGCAPPSSANNHNGKNNSTEELTEDDREQLLAEMFFSNDFLVDHFMLGSSDFKHDKPIDSVSAAENAFAGYYEWLKKNRTIEHDGISKVRTHGDFYYSVIKGSDGIIYAPMGRDCVYVGTPLAF